MWPWSEITTSKLERGPFLSILASWSFFFYFLFDLSEQRSYKSLQIAKFWSVDGKIVTVERNWDCSKKNWRWHGWSNGYSSGLRWKKKYMIQLKKNEDDVGNLTHKKLIRYILSWTNRTLSLFPSYSYIEICFQKNDVRYVYNIINLFKFMDFHQWEIQI